MDLSNGGSYSGGQSFSTGDGASAANDKARMLAIPFRRHAFPLGGWWN